MYRTVKTDYANLEYGLNAIIREGSEIVQILPSVEYDATLYVIVYKEKEE